MATEFNDIAASLDTGALQLAPSAVCACSPRLACIAVATPPNVFFFARKEWAFYRHQLALQWPTYSSVR
jgi:hypothetical protein